MQWDFLRGSLTSFINPKQYAFSKVIPVRVKLRPEAKLLPQALQANYSKIKTVFIVWRGEI